MECIERLRKELYNLSISEQYARLFLSCADPEKFSCNLDDLKYILETLMEILTENLLSYDENGKIEEIINDFADINIKTGSVMKYAGRRRTKNEK